MGVCWLLFLRILATKIMSKSGNNKGDCELNTVQFYKENITNDANKQKRREPNNYSSMTESSKFL